ncbi:hypothetical protein Tco_0493346 [Tanacetum coccineum]
MSSMSEDIQCAGSDTRPPMLDRTDFESWQQRIRLYCLGKDNGENIMKSITEGPFQMGTIRDTLTEGGEGALHLGPELLNNLSAEEKERYKADIRATNILLQGKLKDIYSLINHYTDAKDIWETVELPQFSSIQLPSSQGLLKSSNGTLSCYKLSTDAEVSSTKTGLKFIQLTYPPLSIVPINKIFLKQTVNLVTRLMQGNKAPIQDRPELVFQIPWKIQCETIRKDHFRETMQEKFVAGKVEVKNRET